MLILYNLQMKLTNVLLASVVLLSIGCNKEEEIITVSDLARALHIVPAQLELPIESYQNQELYFFVKEKSDGRSDWSSAFKSPAPGGSVKFLSNSDTNEIKILVNDVDGKWTTTIPLKRESYSKSSGWPMGMVSPEKYILRFAETQIGLTASDIYFHSFVDEETQREAENSNWVRYRLVSASDVPEDAPKYVHHSIEMNKQIQSGDDNSE